MMFMPFQVLGIWFRGLLSVAMLAGAVWFLRDWNEHRTIVVHVPAVQGAVEGENATIRRQAVDRPDGRGEIVAATPETAERRRDWQFGWNWRTAELLAGLLVAFWSLGGGLLLMPLIRRRGENAARNGHGGENEPKSERGGEVHRLRGPSGSELNVEIYGPPAAPPLVLTHGWGCNATEWYYLKKELAGRFRLIVWDLPGLGLSKRPSDNDWALEKLAGDLNTVLELAGDRPAVLLGHSIGGMITLTFCRLFPEALGTRVSGLVLAHTTYTDPARTTAMSGLMTAIEKPILVPLCYLMIPMAPVLWLSNLLSYLNGSLQRSAERSGFSGHETYGQLDFAARFNVKAWPAVIARGMLAMSKYDATAVLSAIDVPTLIIAGDKDQTTVPEASRFMNERIHGSTLSVLSPAKHMGLIDHHLRFSSLVETFADSLTQVVPTR